MSNFFFQAKKKEAKRHRDTCDCVPSPATLKVSEKLRCVAPLNAFWVSELINARFLTVGTVVPDCPNKMAAGASHPPHYKTGDHRTPLRYGQKRVTKRKNSFQGDKNGRKSKNLGNKTICRSRRTGYSHDGVFQRLSAALSLVPQSRGDKPAKTACVFCQ